MHIKTHHCERIRNRLSNFAIVIVVVTQTILFNRRNTQREIKWQKARYTSMGIGFMFFTELQKNNRNSFLFSGLLAENPSRNRKQNCNKIHTSWLGTIFCRYSVAHKIDFSFLSLTKIVWKFNWKNKKWRKWRIHRRQPIIVVGGNGLGLIFIEHSK